MDDVDLGDEGSHNSNRNKDRASYGSENDDDIDSDYFAASG